MSLVVGLVGIVPSIDTKHLELPPMKIPLICIAAMVSASISHASSPAYYQCTPAGCAIEGRATVASNINATKYPIVLVHGLFGSTPAWSHSPACGASALRENDRVASRIVR